MTFEKPPWARPPVCTRPPARGAGLDVQNTDGRDVLDLVRRRGGGTVDPADAPGHPPPEGPRGSREHGPVPGCRADNGGRRPPATVRAVRPHSWCHVAWNAQERTVQ